MEMPKAAQDILKQTRLQDDIHEGAATRAIENQGARIPSGVFLSLAIGGVFLSTAIGMRAKQENKWMANFVGQWALYFMPIGIYNKIVKVESEGRRELLH